jgi:hypothetical protein
LTFLAEGFWKLTFHLIHKFLNLDGRCHRHGQTNAVYVKCYYVPMSMESQLLERRKRAKEGSSRPVTSNSNDDTGVGTAIKFSNLYGEDSDDDA